jgi:uncharacterized membrane protein
MKHLIIVSVIILVLDMLYLSNYGAKPFINMVEKIQNEKSIVKLSSAAVAYALLILAVHQFVLEQPSNYFRAFMLGLIIYGVFDSTNMALFNKYDIQIAIEDSLWGGILFATTLYIYNIIVDLKIPKGLFTN